MHRASKLVSQLCREAGQPTPGWEVVNNDTTVRLWVVKEDGKTCYADVTKFGAHLTHWQDEGRPPLIFMSHTSKMDKSKAIRGGIPVLFPQFGNKGPIKQSHGFARVSEWTVDDSQSMQGPRGSDARVLFVLEASAATKKHWDFDFRCEYTVTLTSTGALKLALKVINTGAKDLSFTGGLHTYFQVSDIDKVAVVLDADDQIKLTGAIDRQWINTPSSISIIDEGHMRAITIEKSGFEDLCIWNPWQEGCQKMADLHDYRTMLCVEPIQINPPVAVKPGQSWTGQASHKVEYCPL